ncbi:hypothetical protein GFS31_16630 [Leptolyngbya sp. BL0902]|uniref:hypothetical protein n=1 Tax=Leptolyngbya sp. BL0902 TaxID=1115757 RepID=UPI0018E7D808|nr:hypothetical protein [Leptolyngbya sp. BL0902]QQE64978.1 hypothetical protein GFS31_16630 [Leptolyngbya sp. BL0902]
MKAILLKLLFEAVPAENPPSEEDNLGFQDPWPHPLTIDDVSAYSHGADPNAVFDPGDHPVVQTQFEALLKRRLSQDIAQHPPLFPWEQALQDYPDHLRSEADLTTLWLDHLRTLEVPANFPEEVLTELFGHCQRVARQTAQLGRQLVEAVEDLFPNQPQTLVYVAGLVARPNARSATTEAISSLDYTTASTQQQIALTMLAARSIFEALSLVVSPLTPSLTRTWTTTDGPLSVTASRLTDTLLEIRAELPAAGAVTLTGLSDTLHADRSSPGDLILQLTHPHPQTPYVLEVSLGQEMSPLRFQIVVEA